MLYIVYYSFRLSSYSLLAIRVSSLTLETVLSVDGHILFVLIKSATSYLVTSVFLSMNRSHVSEMSSST